MKGIVFTEFLSMVENAFGLEVTDSVITSSKVKNKGAYTSVGTYDHRDILQLVSQLSILIGTPIPSLVKSFGKHLHGVFVRKFPEFYLAKSDCFEFLKSVDSFIHVEVKKLYPDAELPTFDFEQRDSNTLILRYESKRPFALLAEGLICGAIAHYGQKISLETLDTSKGQGTSCQFTLTKQA